MSGVLNFSVGRRRVLLSLSEGKRITAALLDEDGQALVHLEAQVPYVRADSTPGS